MKIKSSWKFSVLKRITVLFFLIVIAMNIISLRHGDAFTKSIDPAFPNALPPSLLVTKTAFPDISGDLNGNGVVNPGDRINYTITVSNSGTDATNVIVQDVLNENLTLLSGSLKAAPVAKDDSFQTIGNTQLQVAAAQTISQPGIFVAGNVLANDVDPNGGTLSASLGTVSAGAVVSMNADGTFTYTPAAGFTGTDTFTYNLIDNPNDGFTVTGTVSINVSAQRVWYVKNDVGSTTGLGRSSDPFDLLSDAQAASAAGDTIYVYSGNGTTTGQNSGIQLKANQRLIGSGVALTVPVSVNNGPNPTVLLPKGAQPQIGNANAGQNGVTIGSNAGVEIQGLNISGSADAINANYTGATGGTLLIANNTIRSAGNEGIEIDGNSTGTINVAINNNLITSTGTAIDVARLNGTVRITGFSNNSISGDTLGAGFSVNTVIFDADPVAAGYQTVNAGNLSIGQSGNPIGTAGMNLAGAFGDLSFTDLDIYAGNGTALVVQSTNAFNAATASGFRIQTTANAASLVSTNGAAADITTATIDLQLAAMSSTNSAVEGVELNTVSGTFSAPAGSTITNAANADFLISGATNPTITYNGTITDDLGTLVSISNQTGGTKSFTGAITDGNDGDGAGIVLNSNTGATINFSGGLLLSTGSNPAFAATGGGTVNVCDENPCNPGTAGSLVNQLTTTTSTALNVTNTTIGANKLEFRSISAGTPASGPANGILLNNTGSSGGLTVNGTGSAGSGGTIQKAITGISLISTSSVNLNFMMINTSTNDGINGNSVTGFALANSSLSNNGTGTVDEGIEFDNLWGTAALTNVTISGSSHNHVFVDNTSGTLNSLTISGGSYNNNSAANGNNGIEVDARVTATISGVTIDSTTVSGNKATGVFLTAADTATFNNAIVQSSAFTNNNIAMDINKSQASSMTFKIQNNATITGHRSHAINIFTAAGAGTAGSMQGRITGNTIGNAGVSKSGSAIGNCLRLVHQGVTTTGAYVINSNNMRQCYLDAATGGRPVDVHVRAGSGGGHLTVTNNNIQNDDPSNPTNGASLLLQANDGNTLVADVRNNTLESTPAFDLVDGQLILSSSNNSRLYILDNAPLSGSNTAAAAKSEVAGSNTGSVETNEFNGGQVRLTTVPLNQPNIARYKPNENQLDNLAQTDSPSANYNADPLIRFDLSSALKRKDSISSISFDLGNVLTQQLIAENVQTNETIKTPSTSYLASVRTILGDALNSIAEVSGKLGSAMSPTVYSQELSVNGTKNEQTTAVAAIETVCVDGNNDANNCTGGFSLPENKSTTITFTVTVNSNSTAASIPNSASITAAGGINQNSNTVDTTVVQPPSIAKDFVAQFISVGGTTDLNFTITNPNPSTQLTGVSVIDVLPAGLSVSNSTASACGGTNNLVVTAATRTIQLTNGTINGGANCQFTVSVTGSAEGVQNNITQNVASTNGGQGNTATDSVTVINPPALTKSFTPDQILLGSTSTLQFTLSNSNIGLALNTLAFSDALPSGVTAPDTAATTVCADGFYSITANVISFTKPSLAAGANCQFSVTVTGTTVGVKTNTTSTVTTSNSGNGAAAMADLTVNSLLISGNVVYAIPPINQNLAQAQQGVEGVLMSVTGANSTSDTTDANGFYEVEIQTFGGQYTVTPTKTGDVNGISAFDATLVLRHVAAGGEGINALSVNQQLAADTDSDNFITAFDAVHILRFVAGMGQQSQTTGQTGKWKFIPAQNDYNSVTTSLSGQNFDAILVGELDGDWVP